jgi:hypothetical protein
VARNNLTWIKGDITGDIYYDNFHLESKDIQYLRLYLMVKGVVGSAAVKGLRVCVYGPLAELVYGHVRKGSWLGVIGHIQQRTTRQERWFSRLWLKRSSSDATSNGKVATRAPGPGSTRPAPPFSQWKRPGWRGKSRCGFG